MMPEQSTSSEQGVQKKTGGNPIATKLGPLPVWGWVVAAIGAYLVYHWIKNRNVSSATMPDNGTTPSVAPSGSVEPITTPLSTSPPSTSGNAASWLAAATASTERLGYSPALVKISLERYLSGEQLDEQEWHVVAAAINLNGQPSVSGTLGSLAHPKKVDVTHKVTHIEKKHTTSNGAGGKDVIADLTERNSPHPIIGPQPLTHPRT